MAQHLVTGGSGFLGIALVQRLLELGQNVRILDPISPSIKHPNLEHLPFGILDSKSLPMALSGVDIVHHLASAVPLVKSNGAFEQTNVEGTKLIFSAARHSGVKNFVYVSSSAVYGKTNTKICPLTESSPTLPFEAYGQSKLKAEQFLLDSNLDQDLTLTILRPRTIVGPGRLGIFDLLFRWIYQNKNIYLIGNGQNRLQFIHTADVVEACVLAARQNNGGVYNIGAKEFRPLRDSIRSLCLYAQSRSKIVPTPVWPVQLTLAALNLMHLTPFSVWHYQTFHQDYFFDTTKAETELGWTPRYSNDEMLIEAYDWYRKNNSSLNTTGSIHQRPLKKGLWI